MKSVHDVWNDSKWYHFRYTFHFVDIAGIIFPSCLQGGQNGGRGVTSICHLECMLLLEAASMNHSPFASSFPEAIPAQGPYFKGEDYFRGKLVVGESFIHFFEHYFRREHYRRVKIVGAEKLFRVETLFCLKTYFWAGNLLTFISEKGGAKLCYVMLGGNYFRGDDFFFKGTILGGNLF